jgi:hypothetical protein
MQYATAPLRVARNAASAVGNVLSPSWWIGNQMDPEDENRIALSKFGLGDKPPELQKIIEDKIGKQPRFWDLNDQFFINNAKEQFFKNQAASQPAVGLTLDGSAPTAAGAAISVGKVNKSDDRLTTNTQNMLYPEAVAQPVNQNVDYISKQLDSLLEKLEETQKPAPEIPAPVTVVEASPPPPREDRGPVPQEAPTRKIVIPNPLSALDSAEKIASTAYGEIFRIHPRNRWPHLSALLVIVIALIAFFVILHFTSTAPFHVVHVDPKTASVFKSDELPPAGKENGVFPTGDIPADFMEYL